MLRLIKDFDNIVKIKNNITKIYKEKDCINISDCLFGLMTKNKFSISKKILSSFNHDNLFVKTNNYKLKF